MKVSELLQQQDSNPITCGVGNTVGEAARIITQHSVGALPVIDIRNELLMGIISERDIARAVAEKGAEAAEMSVTHIMTRDVTVIGPDSLLNEAMRIMGQLTIRHLPVVQGSKLLGVISQRDILKAILDYTVGFIFGDPPPDERK